MGKERERVRERKEKEKCFRRKLKQTNLCFGLVLVCMSHCSCSDDEHEARIIFESDQLWIPEA